MAAVGLDMGNFSSYIGVARAGGIEIIANEYSDRLTPTYITFDKSTRCVGQASKAMEITNSKNTICNFKRLLGRQYQDIYVQREKDLNAYSIVEGKGGSVNIEVNYLNERKRFTSEQITGIMLSKLKHITDDGTNTKAIDCVIGVPCFFTDAERRAMLNAAQIAGWNCLRLLNETTAVALTYGIYKADLPEQTEKPRLVAFVDIGYTSLQASIVALNKGKLKIIATTFDMSLGGRDFDGTIMDAIYTDFKQRYKIDSYSTVKSKLRLRLECEKAKKLMSSNVQPIPITLECFVDDKDVSGKISRNEFEELIKPLIERIRFTLANLLKDAEITADDIESVEIVGGSTRIPAVKQVVQDVFRKAPMTTMNADESVARGCALMCAMLSPTFKVREFKIEDCQPYPITLSWFGGINEDNEIEIFGRWCPVPSTKLLSCYKKEPLTITARYSYPNNIPFSEARIGQYTIEQIQPQSNGTPAKIKVKVRLDRNGIFSITQASIVDPNEEFIDDSLDLQAGVENEQIQNPLLIKEPKENFPSTNEIQQDKTEDYDEAKQKTTKKKIKEIDLPIASRQLGPTKAELDRLIEQERDMKSYDQKEKERSDAKNAVEEYVYEMRDKLLDGGQYEKYSDDRTRMKLLQDLRTVENWLYHEGTNLDRGVYIDKLKSLKTLGEPIRNRYHEAESRSYLLQDFMKSILCIDETIKAWHTRSNDRYSHLDKNDIEKVYKIFMDKQKWYDYAVNRFKTLRPHEDPPILCSQIKQERDTLERECWLILNKPKPKVELPKETPADYPKRQVPLSTSQTPQYQSAPTHPAPPPPQPPPTTTSSSSHKKFSSSKNR